MSHRTKSFFNWRLPSVLWIALMAALLVVACKSDDDDSSSEGGEESSEETNTRDPELADTAEAARFLGIERAGWSESIAPGNFARLTVINDEGNSVDLSVETLDVDVTIEGRMARTQVTQVFKNHLPRQIEGTYEFQLPEGAAISRLAMDVNGTMMEGELVERERAREIYESIVRRKKDPALLEWQGGNRFKTQIFPIFANDTKKVVLAYEQLLPEGRDGLTYQYSLPRLSGDTANEERMGTFDFDLTVMDGQRKLELTGYPSKVESKDGQTLASVTQKNFLPAGPLEVAFETDPDREPIVRFAQRKTDTKTENFYLLDIVPKVPAPESTEPRSVVVAIDTSASLGDPVVDQAKVATLMLIDQLPAGTKFNVVHGDYGIHTCSDAPLAHEDFKKVAKCLEKLDSGGASDISGLLDAAVDAAQQFEGPASVVLLSDGTASLGELDGDVMRGKLARSIGDADISVHTVAIGHAPAEGSMRGLAEAGAGHYLRMTPAEDPQPLVAEMQQRVREPLLTDVKVEAIAGKIEGLSPAEPVNLARGEALAVLGRLDSERAKVRLTGKFQGETVEKVYSVAPKDIPADKSSLLSNFWARAEIGNMHREGVDTPRVVAFSLEYGVMSPYTSFLVLENDAAYQRFQVERRKQAQLERDRDEAQAAADQTARNLEKSDKDLQDVLEEPAMKKKESAKQPRRERRRPSPAKTAAAPPGDAGGEGFGDFEAAESEAAFDEPTMGLEEMPVEEEKWDDDAVGGLGTGSGKGWGGGGRGARPRRPPSAQITVAHAAMFGKAPRDQVGFTLNNVTSSSRWCTRNNLTTAGHLVLEFKVGADGKATDINTVKSGVKPKKAADCVTDALKKQTFAKPTAGEEPYEVRVRFTLQKGWNDAVPALTAEERIAELEQDMDGLGPVQLAELINLHLSVQNEAKADEVFKKAWNDLQQQPNVALRLFAQNSVMNRFSKEFLETIDLLLKDGANQNAVNRLVNFAQANGSWNELTSRVGEVRMEAWLAQSVLRSLVNAGQTEPAAGLLKQWETVYSARELLDIVHNERLESNFREQVFNLTTAAITAGDADPVMVARNIESGNALNKSDQVVANIKTACSTSTTTVLECRGWVSQVAPDRMEPIMLEVTQKRLESMDQIRARDIGNVELIKEFAGLLRDRKREDEADRLLSEIVEFNPHDPDARQVWAEELSMLERPLDACEAHGHTVQLDPRRRDLFRSMMSIRRQHEGKRKEIRECIVQGVSNLPVNRAVSLILTWEDPEADVDLHIHEPSGDHVFFMSKESSNGGLLYYDIRDGFGPEIYVLGSGPGGEYKLNLVYFRGDAPSVSGTLTVLRNAGSANETREDIPFTLKGSDPDTEIEIGKFVMKK